MAPRQLWIFTFGCWTAVITALIHLAGHIVGPSAPANDTERQLNDLATSYRFALPGGSARTLMDFLDGFSLMFALMLATLGGLGIVIARRGHEDMLMMTAASRVLTIGFSGLLVISLTHFFIVPSLCLALAAVCFAIASVRP